MVGQQSLQSMVVESLVFLDCRRRLMQDDNVNTKARKKKMLEAIITMPPDCNAQVAVPASSPGNDRRRRKWWWRWWKQILDESNNRHRSVFNSHPILNNQTKLRYLVCFLRQQQAIRRRKPKIPSKGAINEVNCPINKSRERVEK